MNGGMAIGFALVFIGVTFLMIGVRRRGQMITGTVTPASSPLPSTPPPKVG